MRTARSPRRRHRLLAATVAGAIAATVPAIASAAPAADAFFTYSGTRALSSYAPGDVLASRVVPYHLAGVATGLRATQILYRTTDAQQRPAANVTSIVAPAGPVKGVVSYQSVYDSLNPEDAPSRAVAGDFSLFGFTPRGRNIAIGNVAANAENTVIATLLGLGYAINIPDTEGQGAHFAAGPEYGTNTLDSLRAIDSVPSTRVTEAMRIGLLGYSGGAIASGWASILAPSYAPDIDRRLVGTAEGGVLVNPATNLRYVSGSVAWAGVAGMAVVGLARAYGIDFDKYTSAYGKQVLRQLSDASILNSLYPGLTWQKIATPQYADPLRVPEYVEVVNKVNMGTAPVPTVPMYIAQAALGQLEGTAPQPGVGTGDGVMVAGDVRALARRYCANGLRILYQQYDLLSHTTAAGLWLPQGILWLLDRFANKPAPSTCGAIAPGNALTPQALRR